MKETREKTSGIIWIEASGFSFLIMMSWLTEALHIPHLIFGEAFTPDWHRALLRTVVLLVIWLWVHLLTRRLLKRLHHLEEYLRICGWCRKVCHEGEWLEMEKYFSSKFAMKTSHGMCRNVCKRKKTN
jgi:ABC-type Mn2+/Zn2+ transport system permease subunit